MRIPRFMLSPEQLQPSGVELTGPDFRHCRVLRLQPGEAVRICDGQGREWLGSIRGILKDRVQVDLGEELHRVAEPELQVTLYQGWARGDKLDFTLEKTTELGLARFVPMLTQFSQMKPHAGGARWLQRWQEIARQAARQSERLRIPEIASPLTFAQAVAEARQAEAAFILYEGAEASAGLRAQVSGLPGIRRAALLVGPEGGFAPAEAELALAAGIIPISLGPRILRSETAGVAAVALAMYGWGDLGG